MQHVCKFLREYYKFFFFVLVVLHFLKKKKLHSVTVLQCVSMAMSFMKKYFYYEPLFEFLTQEVTEHIILVTAVK